MTKYGIHGVEIEPTPLHEIIERDSGLYCQCETMTRLCCAVFPWAKSLVAEHYDRLLWAAEKEVEFQINVMMQHLCDILQIHQSIHFEPGLYAEAKKVRIETAIRESIHIAIRYIESPTIDFVDIMHTYATGGEK